MLLTMVAFSAEVISSYAVLKKPFWGALEPETTMRCLGAMIKEYIEEQRKDEKKKSKVVSGESYVVELC